jgi:hypothetical protein
MSLVIQKDATNVSVTIRIIDSSDGTPETGVVWNTAGIDLEYRREGAASVDITEATLAALTDAHSDGGFLHIGNGYYRLDVPDAAFATGANGVLVHGTVTGMVVIGEYIQLVDYNPFDAVRMGMTALPNAAADAAGGLPISDAGGLDMDAMSGITLSGTANAGDTATQITLTGGVATDNYYNGQLVVITGGTGVGQARTILSYLAAGTVATPTRDWTVAPDGTSTFVVISADVPGLLEAGIAQAGAAGSITLNAAASAINSTYLNNHIMITGGTGIGQTRLISGYTGATKVATVVPNWTTNPDATSIYQVLPAARVDVAGWLGNLVTGDGDWAQLQSDATAILADTNELQTDDVPGLIAALNNLSAANVNAEVVDVLKTDTITEPSQAIPPTTGVATMEDALRYLYFALTNRVDSDTTANFLEFWNRAEGAVQWKKAISDDGSIFTEDTGESGP